MDVLCLDESRVILKGRSKDNDYIHANWVVLPSSRKYICTQAPLDETAEDFWFMVYQEKVSVIIMLCDTIEAGEVKCMEYYPMKVGKEIKCGEMKIKNLKKDASIDTIVCFTISVQQGFVNHYKWPDWPDRGAPPNASPLLELLVKTRAMFKSGPVVVHCSAGIGRTGTFCAIDYATDRIDNNAPISIPDAIHLSMHAQLQVVKAIRKQRLHSVQTTMQYLYLYNCVIEYVSTKKAMQKQVDVRKFQRDYEKYLRKFNERNARVNS
ncbi:unnamed protein product [Anisakis simplex]|uniref:Protein-tyrosine phosphatase n=1 Tax=Anisakis simplex TaxID=6269 RepID=A0A0M3JYE0_ANISI|nr:unnamed protein product [Anisakis simplex]